MSIATVTVEALGQAHRLRLTTAAGVRIERELKLPFAKLLQDDLEGRIGFDFCATVIAACLADGAGGSAKVAMQIMDSLGLQRSAELVMELFTTALPRQDDGGDAAGDGAGNGL